MHADDFIPTINQQDYRISVYSEVFPNMSGVVDYIPIATKIIKYIPPFLWKYELFIN